jgi:uncharacterized membrane protein YccC
MGLSGLNRRSVEHAVRTTVAASASLAIAKLFRLPEAEWAAISTMVVTQSTLGAALSISGERFAGTALGALAGGLLATYLHSGTLAFIAGLFVLGLVCALLHLDRAAYRFAGITLAIVVLITRSQPVAVIAAHRFFEVSLGIATGLAFTAIWPEREEDRVAEKSKGSGA